MEFEFKFDIGDKVKDIKQGFVFIITGRKRVYKVKDNRMVNVYDGYINDKIRVDQWREEYLLCIG